MQTLCNWAFSPTACDAIAANPFVQSAVFIAFCIAMIGLVRLFHRVAGE